MLNQLKSAYVHVPFCKKICSYCDFCKNFYNEKLVDDYLLALNDEINSSYQGETLETLYVGGGTPSCLPLKTLSKLFKVLRIFNLQDDYEFTFECNYEDITESLLKLLVSNRVNRISIGVQSFNNKYEKLLERNINKDLMLGKVKLAKKYFNNINVDIMYALPGQTISDLESDVNMFLSLNVSHISTYCLMIEPHTKLGIKNVSLLADDYQSKMYDLIVEKLKNNGFKHYEISNFAKEGHASKHNLVYWNNEEYYGFGAGASGFVRKVRYDNTKSVVNYVNGMRKINVENVTKKQMMLDEVMLGFRKISGINKDDFFNKYGVSLEDVFDVKPLLKIGLLTKHENNVMIPESKLFVSNEIILQTLNNYRLNK